MQRTSPLRRWFQFSMWLMALGQVNAEPVFVGQGAHKGAGYTFTDGSACFLVTAEHVVPADMPITVVDQQRNKTTATILRRGSLLTGGESGSDRFDVAVARLSADANVACTTSWHDGDAADEFFANVRNLESPLRSTRVLENGSVRQQRLQVREKRDHMLQLVPFGRADRFEAGDSGTFLTVSDGSEALLAGMIVRIDTAQDTVLALSQSWLHSMIGPALVPQAAPANAASVRVALGNLAMKGNRSIEHSAALMYESLKTIEGIEPSLGGHGDIVISGSVHSARPQTKRNECAARRGQVDLFCMVTGQSKAPYLATVPVQLEFRIDDRVSGRVMPYLYLRTFTGGAESAQEAESAAIDTAIRNGVLQALTEVGVLLETPPPPKKKNAVSTFALSDAWRRLAVTGERGIASPKSGFAGRWSGSYQCGRRTIPLTMDIRLEPSGQAQAMFRFCNGGNRALGLPDGTWQFSLTGTAGSTLDLQPVPARADPQLRMPGGYKQVAVQLHLVSAEQISGQIVRDTCTAVTLTRHRGSERGACD